jgi:hypothetical protein
MPDHYMDDIYSDINRKKQLEDAQENKEFDRDIDAYNKGKENLTDEERVDRLKDAARKKRLYNDISGSINGFEEAKKDPNLVKELQGIGFETAVNVATDSLTTALGWAPPLYAVVNFLSAGGANLVAQKMIRGEENISWGEAFGSAGLGTIPFMNPAAGKLTKVVGKPQTIKRAVVGGGLTGVGYQQIEKGINERRVISPTEAALGFTAGGAAGGAFKSAADTGQRILAQIKGISPMGDLAYGLGGTGGAGAMKGSTKAVPKLSTNERLKQSLIANEVIELPPAYKGGPITFRPEADFFDVSAALIGGGQEDARDALGRKIDYNRAKVTEFGATRAERRDTVFNHIKNSLRRNKKDGTGTNITRREFNEYAKEQIAAEKDLRKAIKLLNIRSYASLKNIDLSDYPTSEAQLELLNKINKAKVKPRRNKTDTSQQFQNKVRKWERDTAPYQQFTDYKETFDYGHIISAKTGFRMEDLGMNRISNTEIEAAHNIASYDPYTKKIIEILQEGNRERGSRRDYLPVVQRMRNTAGSVVEDFVKWKANKDNDPVNLTKILDKFIPRDQHDNYLQFIQKKFYKKRSLGYATIKEFVEEVYGFDYKIFKDLPQKHKNKVEKEYLKQRVESGNVTGKQQYDQAGEWMLEAIDEFIGLHHLSKPKKLPKQEDIDLPQNIDDLMDMILPDRLPDE